MKILVVDDDAAVAETCRRVLSIEGYEVRTADGVPAGVEALRRESFDLLITDIKMPGKDGFELIQWVRQAHPALGILVSTGYLTPDTIERGRLAGVAGFVAKPFTPDELLTAVGSALERAVVTAPTR